MKTIIEGVPAPIQTIVSGVSKVKLKGIVDDCADYRREVLETSLREWNLTNRIVEAQVSYNLDMFMRMYILRRKLTE